MAYFAAKGRWKWPLQMVLLQMAYFAANDFAANVLFLLQIAYFAANDFAANVLFLLQMSYFAANDLLQMTCCK